MILEALTKDMPPMLKGLFAGVQAMLPVEALQGIDQILTHIAADLANDRNEDACNRMKTLLEKLGIDLNDYRDHDQGK